MATPRGGLGARAAQYGRGDNNAASYAFQSGSAAAGGYIPPPASPPPTEPSPPSITQITFDQGGSLLNITFDRALDPSPADISGWFFNFGEDRYETGGVVGAFGNILQLSVVSVGAAGKEGDLLWNWNGDDGPILFLDSSTFPGPVVDFPIFEA